MIHRARGHTDMVAVGADRHVLALECCITPRQHCDDIARRVSAIGDVHPRLDRDLRTERTWLELSHGSGEELAHRGLGNEQAPFQRRQRGVDDLRPTTQGIP